MYIVPGQGAKIHVSAITVSYLHLFGCAPVTGFQVKQ